MSNQSFPSEVLVLLKLGHQGIVVYIAALSLDSFYQYLSETL